MSTKERKEIGIFRNFNQFSKIWRTRAIYRADKIGERAEPWPTLTSTLKLVLLKIQERSWWLRNGKNWAMSKARVLVLIFLIHPKQMKCMRVTLASTVEHCLSLSSWLGWIKLKSFTNTFLNEFTDYVEEDNGSERFRRVIWFFVGFRYDNRSWYFEMWWSVV